MDPLEVEFSSQRENDLAYIQKRVREHGCQAPVLRIFGCRRLSVNVLAQLINTTDTWAVLEVHCVGRIRSSPKPIYAALSKCVRLKKITYFVWDDDVSADCLTDWGRAMACVPKLEEIRIEQARNDTAARIFLPILAKSKHLKVVHAGVGHCYGYNHFGSDTFARVISSCMACSTLQEISWQSGSEANDFSVDQVELVTELIRTSRLRKLSFRVGERSTSLKSWALAMRENDTIQVLEVRSNNAPGTVHLDEVVAFRDALREKNFVLKRLVVDDWTSDNCEIGELYTPLESAATVETKKGISEQCRDYLAEIYFLLRLNNTGRDKIMAWEDATPCSTKWLVGTVANETDLSVVYTYLRHNPSVIKLGSPGVATSSGNKRSALQDGKSN